MLISWTAADSSRRDRDYWQVLLIACVNHGEEFHQLCEYLEHKIFEFSVRRLAREIKLSVHLIAVRLWRRLAAGSAQWRVQNGFELFLSSFLPLYGLRMSPERKLLARVRRAVRKRSLKHSRKSITHGTSGRTKRFL